MDFTRSSCGLTKQMISAGNRRHLKVASLENVSGSAGVSPAIFATQGKEPARRRRYQTGPRGNRCEKYRLNSRLSTPKSEDP